MVLLVADSSVCRPERRSVSGPNRAFVTDWPGYSYPNGSFVDDFWSSPVVIDRLACSPTERSLVGDQLAGFFFFLLERSLVDDQLAGFFSCTQPGR